MKGTKRRCIYCPSGVGSTRDHVPPRGFFQETIPLGTQLITVPCCEACRERDSSNDELVRNILASLNDTEPLDYVTKYVVPRRDRSLAASHSQFLRIMKLLRPVPIRNNKSEYTGDAVAFSLDRPCIDQFLERVGRALLFKHFKQGFFEADFGWRVNPPLPDKIYQHAVANYPTRNILDVIAYSVRPEMYRIHWIILQFYGAIEFLLRFEKRQ